MKKDPHCSAEANTSKKTTDNDQDEKGVHEAGPWANIVKEQIMTIRDEGKTNMLDTNTVFRLALAKDYLQLADFIFMNTPSYLKFILTGDISLIVNISAEIGLS